jgi:hypothetical protein
MSLRLKFSGDGKTLVATGGTPARFGEIELWDVDGRKLKHSVTLTNDSSALSLAGMAQYVGHHY